MPTNEERREAAAWIRNGAHDIDINGYIKLAINVVDRGDGATWGQLALKLADLIEPEPERTCKNLYKQRDKKGRIPVDNGVCFVCSECDAYVSDAESYHSGLYPSYNSDEFHYDIEFSYCPNCGARIQK